jgi:glycosyltransferase involved in cell wall biosynthesis
MCEADDGEARPAGRERLRITGDEFLLVYFGYVYPDKGLETLLQAFHVVRSRGERARLTMVGELPAHLYEERLSYLRELEAPAALELGDEVVGPDTAIAAGTECHCIITPPTCACFRSTTA